METELQIQQFRDQQLAWLNETIGRQGWAIIGVFGHEEDPPFAYTTGLTDFAHHELVAVGLVHTSAVFVLNQLSLRVRSGERLRPGQIIAIESIPVTFVEVSDSAPLLLAANQRYRKRGAPPVPALQVVWSDDSHRFPWEAEYSLSASIQPLLGPNPHLPIDDAA